MTLRVAILFAASVALVPSSARADKLDKESKKWLEEMTVLILPEEEKTFKDLKDKADREEFQKIFWARRNPQGPAAVENPAKNEFDKLRAQADQRFKAVSRPGSATDCARLLILIGEPNEVKADGTGERLGTRVPEVWTYKNRPGFTFVGGELKVSVDAHCQIQATDFVQQFARLAEGKIVSPNIGYRKTADGHLAKLEDQLPKPSPAQTLLKEPRKDFPLTSQPKLVMRGREGATYVAGLVRADGSGLTVVDEAGKKKATLVVAAQAVDDTGRVVASAEQEATGEVGADGAFVGSYGLTLKPGKYTLRAGALDPKTSKGSVDSVTVEMPDFSAEGIAASDLIVLTDVQERQNVDPRDPLAAFFMGTAQLVPRFGNTFSQKEAIQVLAFVYNPQLDPATGKAQMGCTFVIKKDGKNVTSPSEEQVFDATTATPGIGPVPLEKFQPGKYTVQLKITDKLAKKEVLKEASFEVTP
jgi:GWxTD domain-containing protein